MTVADSKRRANVLPLEAYVELLEAGCAHLLLGLGEAAVIPVPLLQLLDDMPWVSINLAGPSTAEVIGFIQHGLYMHQTCL